MAYTHYRSLTYLTRELGVLPSRFPGLGNNNMPSQRYNSEGRDLSRVFGDHASSGDAQSVPDYPMPSSEVPMEYNTQPMSYTYQSRVQPHPTNLNIDPSGLPRSSFYQDSEFVNHLYSQSRHRKSFHHNYHNQLVLDEDFYDFHLPDDVPSNEHYEMVAEINAYLEHLKKPFVELKLPRIRTRAVRDAIEGMYTEVSPLPRGFRLGCGEGDTSINVLLRSLRVPLDSYKMFQLDECMTMDYIDASSATMVVEAMYWMLQTVLAATDAGVSEPMPSFRVDQNESPGYNLEEFLRYCEVDAYATMVLGAEDDDVDEGREAQEEINERNLTREDGDEEHEGEMDSGGERDVGEGSANGGNNAGLADKPNDPTLEFPHLEGDALNLMIGKIVPTIDALCKRYLELKNIEDDEIQDTLADTHAMEAETRQLAADHEAHLRNLEQLLTLLQRLQDQDKELKLEFNKMDAELSAVFRPQFEELRNTEDDAKRDLEAMTTVLKPECDGVDVTIPEVLKMVDELPGLVAKRDSILVELDKLRDELDSEHMVKARKTHESLRLALDDFNNSLDLTRIPAELRELVKSDLENLRIATELNKPFKEILDLPSSFGGDIDAHKLLGALEKLDEEIRAKTNDWNNELSDLRTEKTTLENRAADNQSTINQCKQKIEELNELHDQLLEEEVELDSKLKDNSEEIKLCETTITKLKQDIVKYTKEHDEYRAQLEEKEASIKLQAITLKPMVRDYQGLRKLYEHLYTTMVKSNAKLHEKLNQETFDKYCEALQDLKTPHSVDDIDLPDSEEGMDMWVERRADVYFRSSS